EAPWGKSSVVLRAHTLPLARDREVAAGKPKCEKVLERTLDSKVFSSNDPRWLLR
ncbi:UNVERIFIED_CONTAM: hypothetical protein K2H54_007266, partial [Gekko kuhli]